MNINLDEKRSARQDEGILKYLKNKGIGTLAWTMRFGKTLGGIKITNRFLAKYEEGKVIIVVPSEAIKVNWENYIDTYIDKKYDVSVKTISKVVLDGEGSDNCHLLILDEIHKYLSDNRYRLLEGKLIAYQFLLGLTGTPPDGEAKAMLDKYCPVVDIVSQREAKENGWLAPFIEFNYMLEMSDYDKEAYVKYSIPISNVTSLFRGLSSKLISKEGTQLFRSDYDLIHSCIYGKKFPHDYVKAETVRLVVAKHMGWNNNLDLTVDFNRRLHDTWSPEALEGIIKKYDYFVKQRLDIINDNVVKLDAVIDIYRKFPVSTICFNESIEFAENICSRINLTETSACTCYHSKIKSRPLKGEDGQFIQKKNGTGIKIFGQKLLKLDTIEGMKSGKYKFVSTARALDEGLDIPNLEQVITTAGSTNPIQYEQRNARAKTVDFYNPDKVARIINLCFDNFIYEDKEYICRDRSKLINRQKYNTNEIITVSTLDEIF